MRYLLFIFLTVFISCDNIIQNDKDDDMQKIVYSSIIDSTGIYQIFTNNIEGNNKNKLTSLPKSCIRPIWSPDKENILFLSDYNVYVIKKDGTELKQVSPEGYGIGSLGLYAPSWSTDGKKIYYIAGSKNIVIINIVENKIDIIPFDLWGGYADISFHEDKIVYVGTSHGNLCVMNIDGSNAKDLTADSMWCWWPQWSSYNDYIAFKNSFRGINLFIMDTMGTVIKKIHANPGRLKWSPDGTKLLFDGSYDLISGIYIYDIIEDSITNLEDDIGENLVHSETTCGVDWSSDGNYILYHARTNPVQIVIVDLVNKKQNIIISDYNNKYATFRPR